MKFTIGQSELSGAVAWAAQSVSSRSTLPVLSNVLLRAQDGALTVMSTNLETALALEVPADVADAGALTLPARLLKDTLAGIPGNARIEVDLDAMRMAAAIVYTVEGRRRGQAKIKGIEAAEFPLIPELTGPAALTFTGAELAALIHQSAFAASDAKDTSRPALTGILVTDAADGLIFAATDGYRLAVARKSDVEPLTGQVIIPRRALELADKLAGLSESVELRIDAAGSRIAFDFAGARGFRSARLVAQAIDAKFPDYNAIIPKQAVTSATVDTAEMLRALKMCGLYAQDNSDRVILNVAPGLSAEMGRLRLVAVSQETGDFETELDAVIEGLGIEAAFNVAYLADGLAALAAPTARFEFTRADRPAVLKAAGMTYVVMPMQLQK